MELKIGELNKLKVKRITDIAYMLENDNGEDIFLHFNEAIHELKENDEVEVFLYYDSKRRLSATEHIPTATASKMGFGKCVSVKEGIGCFIDIGISKDILLSKDDLPQNIKGWPNVGDEIPLSLKVRKDSLLCKLPTRDNLNKNIHNLVKGLVVEGIVYGFSSSGITACTKDLEYIYIHNSLLRKRYHIGEVVEITIVGINQDNFLDGSLIKQKEDMRLDDAAMILEKLKSFNTIPLGDASSPEEIAKYFPLSKKAFKRAIGALYKEHKIEIGEHFIKLIK